MTGIRQAFLYMVYDSFSWSEWKLNILSISSLFLLFSSTHCPSFFLRLVTLHCLHNQLDSFWLLASCILHLDLSITITFETQNGSVQDDNHNYIEKVLLIQNFREGRWSRGPESDKQRFRTKCLPSDKLSLENTCKFVKILTI